LYFSFRGIKIGSYIIIFNFKEKYIKALEFKVELVNLLLLPLILDVCLVYTFVTNNVICKFTKNSPLKIDEYLLSTLDSCIEMCALIERVEHFHIQLCALIINKNKVENDKTL
jgi:hypothetical protein